MFTNRSFLLSIFFLANSCAVSSAADKVVVVPLKSTQAAFKGDLYQSIPFPAFKAGKEDYQYTHGWLFGPLGWMQFRGNGAGSLGIFNASVILPDNAIITQLSLIATDKNDGPNISMYLAKYSMTGGATFFPNGGITSESLATDETGIISADINDEIVDNQNYFYTIYVLFDNSPSDLLQAVRIQYHLP